MAEPDAQRLHRLFGPAKWRIAFRKSDFLDYLLMCLLCGAVVWFAYAPVAWLVLPGLLLCVVMAATFPLRHGVELKLPVLLGAPQSVLYMVFHKLRNLNPVYPLALALFAADQLFIALTPQLPHHSALLRELALWLFYVHLVLLTAYRTVIPS